MRPLGKGALSFGLVDIEHRAAVKVVMDLMDALRASLAARPAGGGAGARESTAGRRPAGRAAGRRRAS